MKVTCSLPNAGTNINGIDFESQEDGSVVAIGLSKEDAAQFDEIPGYKIEEDGDEPAKPVKAAKQKQETPAA